MTRTPPFFKTWGRRDRIRSEISRTTVALALSHLQTIEKTLQLVASSSAKNEEAKDKQLHAQFAVDVPFVHAKGGYRSGPGRCAGWQRRHGTHIDLWRIRGPLKRLRLLAQQSEHSYSIIPHLPRGGSQKPRRGEPTQASSPCAMIKSLRRWFAKREPLCRGVTSEG
jgi:hypothetical protein